MHTHQTYFHRNRGEWNWHTKFEILSWRGLLGSDLSWLNKFRLADLLVTQTLFGPFWMWTKVQIQEGFTTVKHSTQLRKWGVCVTRSEKTFFLNPDGSGLRLEGAEYYWPLNWVGVPFTPMEGRVDASATSARYKMPLLGMPVDCTVTLNPEVAEIRISNDWIEARFWLREELKARLAERFSAGE